MQTIQEDLKRIKELLNLLKEETHNGWDEVNNKLEKDYKFNSFKEAMDFVNKAAGIAEKQNHHPDITINYDKVKLSITDHEKGGVSEKCHKFIDALEGQESKKSEQSESEIKERCWKGYTQKGMKTMYGKRYPNCVKKNK